MSDIKVVEPEEALAETPETSAEPEAPADLHRYVKTQFAGVPTTLPSGKVVRWARKKLPSGKITQGGEFTTDDKDLVKELDALAGSNHIHKT
jgi:hypothetical protein